jgi:two-component system, OmpR family, alkaline phosphatase synthesis response regulator PhoP
MARVLVIDDEPDVLLLCRINLSHAGHQVLEALDGEGGLRMAREERPDVVVLDLMMPVMDGYDILKALWDDPSTRDLPVIVLTAKAQVEDRIRSWQDGAVEFLTKPFPPEQLLSAVNRVTNMSPEERARAREEALGELGSAS